MVIVECLREAREQGTDRRLVADPVRLSRSSSAVVILASPANTAGHSPKARLVVTTIEVVS